ncbi:C-C chemokine receptor type 4-like [Ruditapes philippinarum]|uniref:C-C chemokine receptor type 4-like n=1 Tax=Ruditapes philippinarum TaxID=129788 RepID=UPI00295AF991|nr:C-C chemokine receptor type 4-like [Ruditapes philippinarum]
MNVTNLTTNTILEFYPTNNLAELFAMLEELRFKVSDFFWERLSIVFAIISVIGNCFIIAVLGKKGEKLSSTSIFILSLALADLFVSGYFIEGFLVSNDYILGAYSTFDCKFRRSFQILGRNASPLTLCLISVERVFCVVIPHKVKNIFTRKVAFFLLLAVWSISLAFISLYAFNYIFVITSLGNHLCVIPYSEKYISVTYRISSIMGFVLKNGTWLINVICMIIITRTLIQNVVVRGGKSVKTPVKSVTLSLLTVNAVYILFMTPIVLYDGYVMAFMEKELNLFEFYNHINVHNILQFLSNINNVLNIFIYFLLGAKFRKDSKEFLLSFKLLQICCLPKAQKDC